MAKQVEGYCVKCKCKQPISSAKNVVMANGRAALKGKCPDCGTGMYRILGNS